MLKSICKFLASLLWIGLLVIVSCYLTLTIIYSKNYYQQVYIDEPALMLNQVNAIQQAKVADRESAELFLTMIVTRWYGYQLEKPWTLNLLDKMGFSANKITLCKVQQYRLANPLDRSTVEEAIIEIWVPILAINCTEKG